MAIVRSNEELNKYAESKVAKVASTDNAITRFNGTTGEVQDSSVVIDDSGAIELKGSGREINLYGSDGIGYGRLGVATSAGGGVALKGYGSGTSYVDLSAISASNAGVYRIGRDSNIATGQIAEFQIYKHDGSSTGTFKINCKTGDIMNMGALNISKTAVTNGSLAENGNVFSGTYTPVLTNSSNVTSSTAYQCQYMRVGDVVTVSGTIGITSSSNAVAVVKLSLPIGFNITSTTQVAGIIDSYASGSTTLSGTIYGDSASDIALIRVVQSLTTNCNYKFIFTYRIV